MSHQDGLGNNARTRIHNVTGAQVQALIAKLNVLLPYLPKLPLQEWLSKEDFTPGEASGGGGKHVLQEASILSHLRHIHALTDSTAVAIEMGAGTARLSDRLQRVTGARLNHVLVDRQEFQQSRDRSMRTRSRNRPDAVQRVVCDIATFDLAQHCTSSNRCCLCMSKHLCGPACDITIASIGQLPLACRPPCAVATCCHYLCTWESFSGRNFWLQLSLTEDDFIIAVAASQWASVKKPNTQKVPATEEAGDDPWMLPDLAKAADLACRALEVQEVPPPTVSSEEFERTFSRDEKVELGTKLKELLDLSRASRMQELGYRVKLVRFTTRSKEDRLLVASIAHSS